MFNTTLGTEADTLGAYLHRSWGETTELISFGDSRRMPGGAGPARAGQAAAPTARCSRKNLIISADASGPAGSV